MAEKHTLWAAYGMTEVHAVNIFLFFPMIFFGIKITSISSKVFFKNQKYRIVQASPSMHQSNRNSTRYHPP